MAALDAGAAYIDVLPLLKNFSKELQKQVKPQLAQAGASLQRAAGPLRTAGRNLTRYVTLPAAVAGAAILKTSIDFGSAMARIAANSNLTGAQVEKFRGQILDLAGTTAQAPKELADGLYFLASAGLSASQIGPILEASAKASAAGMGEVADVTRITANALNAYKGTALTAAQVTDSLAAAVRAGSAEPDEFASALGRVLPIASKANVSFQEITGSLAAMSNIGLDVDEGVTALRGVLQALEAPGTQAAETLKEIGLSADEVRAAISKDGLVGALDLLNKASDGNIDTMRKVIPNVRALTGFYALSGDRAAAYADALHQTTNAQGALNDAFETTRKEDPAFQWEQLKASAQVLAINLGQKLLPVFQDIVEELGKAVDWFTRLSDAQQENIIKWVALAAVAGPFLRLLAGGLSVLGGAAKLMGAFGGATAAAGASAGAAAGAFSTLSGPVAIAAGTILIATAQTLKMNAAMDEARDTIKTFGVESDASADSVKLLNQEIAHGADGAGHLRDRFGIADDATQEYSKSIRDAEKAHREWFAQVTGSLRSLGTFTTLMEHADRVTKGQAEQVARLAQDYEGLHGRLTKSQTAQIQVALASGRAAEAIKLLRKWILATPQAHRTSFSFPGLDAGIAKMQEFNNQLAAAGVGLRADQTGKLHGLGVRLPGVEVKGRGGPVLPHHSYIVGERGPEMLRMGSSGGTVVPNDRLGATALVLEGPVMLRLDDGTKLRAYISAIARAVADESKGFDSGYARMGGS